MKEFFGTDLSAYNAAGLEGIQSALRYELGLYRLYIVWNLVFMLSGVMYVYFKHQLFTSNEMIWVLALFWSVSGLPFFLLRDFAKNKFAAALPASQPGPNPLLTAVKLLAGLFFGSWGTHVMLIYSFAKYFELKSYGKHLQAAQAA